MEVDSWVEVFEQAVLEPLRFAQDEFVACANESRQVRRLVGRIRNTQVDIDDWLRTQPAY